MRPATQMKAAPGNARTLITGLLLATVLVSMSLNAMAEQRILEREDLFSMAWVGDPKISPEGLWTAYTVSRNHESSDDTGTRIWMIPTAGGDPVAMTSASHSSWSPRWSPDGRYLGFLSAREGNGSQVWVLNRLGGEAYALTDVPHGVSEFAWSPDGKSLALVLQDLEPGHAEALEAGEVWNPGPKPWVIDREHFKSDYIGYLDRRRTHIYRFDLDSKSLHQLTHGDYDDQSPAWSPDGTQILLVSKRVELPDLSTNTDLFLVSATPEEEGFADLRRLTSNPGSDYAPAWSPDGKRVAHITTINPERIYYETEHLGVTDVSTGTTRVITREIDRRVVSPVFTPDGTKIMFMLEDSGEQHLVTLPWEGGALQRLVQGENVVYGFDQGKNGDIAVKITGPQAPSELFALGAGGLRPLTSLNESLMQQVKLGEVRSLTVTSADGTPVETFVVFPPDFKEGDSYPAILNIHGGPQSQWDAAFDFESQLLAAQGYVMIKPNPRGSTGYGYDFSVALFRDIGGVDFADVTAAVDGVVAEGWADPDRLGVMGWSYGGMLTNHIITLTDRYKAAITGASSALYVANYGHDEYVIWWEQEWGKPWEPEARARYEESSPFNRLDKVVTPTLIVGGEEDWNVPIINSEQMYLVLKRRGVETQLVVYPDEYHSIHTPSLEQDLYQRYLDWFAHYLNDE